MHTCMHAHTHIIFIYVFIICTDIYIYLAYIWCSIHSPLPLVHCGVAATSLNMFRPLDDCSINVSNKKAIITGSYYKGRELCLLSVHNTSSVQR